jgi:hypothetical protein
MLRLTLILPVLLLTLLVGNSAFSADFQKGLDAAQRGDYATALKELHKGEESFEWAGAKLKLKWKASKVKTGRYGYPSTGGDKTPQGCYDPPDTCRAIC